MRHLHLILPLPATLDDTALDAALAAMPGLKALLARGRALPAPTCPSTAYCAALGIAQQRDWPVAPFTARAAGLEVGDACWLRLDPVHMDVGLRGPFLHAGLRLSQDEAAQLAALLQPLLESHGLTVFSGPDGIQYVRLDGASALSTTPLDQVDGHQPTRWLPSGEDAPFWTRVLHEVQMALHDHPLNLARDASGQAPVNSLWPWGGGRLAPTRQAPDMVWGEDALLQELALGAGLAAQVLPEAIRRLFGQAGERGLVALPALLQGTEKSWSELDTHWFRPLLAALRWRRLRTARITLVGAAGRDSVLTPRAVWRFWRAGL